MSTIAAAIGRILIALLFVVSGASKLIDPGPASGMLASAGLPTALTIPTGLFEIVLGVALAIGMMTRIAAILLAAFTALTVFFFHNQFNDPAQISTILMHVALIGGLLGIYAHSQISWSYDALRHRRDEDRSVQDAELRAARAEARADARVDAADAVVEPPVIVRKRRWF